jgi:hypothetical protein
MADERLPELPRMLGRYRVREWIEPGLRVRATDTIHGRSAELERVPFGVERVAEREAAIARWRAHGALSHPAIRALLDAGPWQDDAFIAEEEIAAPVSEPAPWLAGAESEGKVRWAAELLGAASVLAEKRLRLPEIAVVVDGYGEPKLAGLSRAEDGDGALDARLLALAAEALEGELAEQVRRANPGTLPALLAVLAQRAGGPQTSFAADVAKGEAALGRAARTRQMTVALVLIGLAFAVIAAVALFAR